MYSEWASLQYQIQSDTGHSSVLHSFPEGVGRDVACSVVRNLAGNLSLGATSSEPSNLSQDKQVKWTMEVLCYGLSLPLSEHDAIRDCVNVYCEWLSALTNPKTCVPRPIIDNPNPYVQSMLQHLYNLFVPRGDGGGISVANIALSAAASKAGADLVKRQALLCHRVLRTVHAAAAESTVLTRDSWEAILKFLLAVNDTLLAPPLVKESIGDQLCERVLSVLFEMWLLACARCFPAPPLWKTFREMCANWRHHEALVIQWHRINYALTAKLLRVTYGPDYPVLHTAEDDKELIPESMDADCLAQSWFRFLHMLQNPVDLCRPQVISNTPKFLHMALTSENVIDPHQHECLRDLPLIFYKAMRGISDLVDAFLGISQVRKDGELGAGAAGSQRSAVTSTAQSGSTPPGQRKAKAFGLGGSQYSNKGSTKSQTMTPRPTGSASSTPSSSPCNLTLGSRPTPAPQRPAVDSILHLFGKWLIEAALAGVRVHGSEAVALSRSRTASFIDRHDHTRLRSSSDPHLEQAEPMPINYEAGRAEACGALCRIFCSHKTGEEILPVYLSRFYIALYYGLQVNENLSGQVLANIIFNSCDLLRVDLDGVMILVPQILTALETILNDLTPKFRSHEQIPAVELRKASIHLLISMLCLPLHFKALPIKHLFGEVIEPPVTFLSLKMRMIELLLRALTLETDSSNTQMLLGGLLLSVQDLAMCEEAEQTTVQETEDGAPPSPTTHHPATASGRRHKMPPSGSDRAYIDTGLRHSAQLLDYDSSHGLFGHAASLVCNRLMASWKMDLNIALAAIEVLSGLAKVRLNNPNMLMCKRTVNWICEFIVYQCSRPAPAHSKPLHSMIVGAYGCLSLWLVEHDYLLQDKECLGGVLEVVELGISGTKSQVPQSDFWESPEPTPLKSKHDKESKSDSRLISTQNRASDVPKLKGEKELKPVSMRVKDAAESLLSAIMDHVGSFPPPSGPESVCSLLDEDALLKYCKDGGLPEQGTPFRYFVLDGATVVGLLEQPLGNDQDPLPTVTALIRGPFGRHAWTMQLRHLPRHHKIASRAYLNEPGRPQPDDNVGVHHDIKHRYFPEVVDSIKLVQADKSIPSLNSVMKNHSSELEKLEGFMRDQISFEKRVQDRVKKERQDVEYPDPETECRPPSISHDFQTARLFLSHYSLLSLESLKDSPNSSVPPSLVMLDTSEHGFRADLEALDAIPCRTNDTVHIFYVKSGQKMPFEILSNVTTTSTVQPTFLELLRSLGWPVDVKKHAGWTGHVGTSWKILPTNEEDEVYPGDTGGSLYDGRQQVLYWADVSSEVAFVVPSPETYHPVARRASVDSSAVGYNTNDADNVFKPKPTISPGLGRRSRSATTSSIEGPIPTSQSLPEHGTSEFQTPPRRRRRPHLLSTPTLGSQGQKSDVLSLGDADINSTHEFNNTSELGRRLPSAITKSLEDPTPLPRLPPESDIPVFQTPPRRRKRPHLLSTPPLGSFVKKKDLVSSALPLWPSGRSPAKIAPSDGLAQASGLTSSKTPVLHVDKMSSASPSPVPEVQKLSRPADMAAVKPKSLSLDLEKPPERAGGRDSPMTPTEGASSRMRRLGSRYSHTAAIMDTKIFVVWLENFEDHECFPAEDLLQSASTGQEAGTSSSSLGRHPETPLYIMFIHALKNGLFRIQMQGQSSRMSLAIPLVDGMVVSRRTLGTLIRQTAINISRRRRLEHDAFQPPHVRRKLKIKELVDKYRNKLIEPEFYTALFQDPS